MNNEFDFAEYYDFDHSFTFDIDFYLDYARQCGSPILELACGTGRLTIPLAQAGLTIHGLDISHNMLAICRQKVGEQRLDDRVHLSHADMADFDLPQKEFALTFIALRSFMLLLTQAEQRACLQHVFDHLRPGGLLIVDLIAPDLEVLAQKPDREFVTRRTFALSGGYHVIRKVRLLEHDRLKQVRRFEFLFGEYDVTGELVRGHRLPMSTRYTFRYEMQLLLEAAGFEITDLFRDFEKNPYDGSGELIVVAKRP